MIDIKGNVVLVGHVVSLIGDIRRFPADNKYIVVDEEVEDGSVILYSYHTACNLENLPIWEDVALRYSNFSNEGIYLERVLDYDVRVVCNFFRHVGKELHRQKDKVQRIGEHCALEKHLLNQYTDFVE